MSEVSNNVTISNYSIDISELLWIINLSTEKSSNYHLILSVFLRLSDMICQIYVEIMYAIGCFVSIQQFK